MKSNYDVVIIGAGPAGSVAAKTIAQAGRSVLLLEKRQEIGAPVRCAEAVGVETATQFIELDSQWIAAEIDAFSVTNPQGDCVIMPPEETTIVLERKLIRSGIGAAGGRGRRGRRRQGASYRVNQKWSDRGCAH